MKNSSLLVYIILAVMAFFALVKVFKSETKQTPAPVKTEYKSDLPESPLNKESESLVNYGSGAMRESNLTSPEGKKLLKDFVLKKDEFDTCLGKKKKCANILVKTLSGRYYLPNSCL